MMIRIATKLVAISILLVVVGCMGCARISFKNDELTYSRFGSQKLEGLDFKKKADGSISVKLGKQEGSAGDLAEAILNLSKKIP